MDQNFQTSFIPQKSIVKERAISVQSISFITIIPVFILVATLIGTGALYFYKAGLVKDIDELKNSFELAKGGFEPTTIAEIQALDKRLRASSAILGQHTAVTPIFEALELITMRTVRFTSFDYTSSNETNNQIAVKLKGVAIGYRSVALQSDLFAKNENFLNPVFSNLQLDDKGSVIFDLNFSVDRSFVNYKQTFLTENNVSF